MVIALDYDDTYTQDPLFWEWFYTKAAQRGHTILMITQRPPDFPVELLTHSWFENRVIYANGVPKREAVPPGVHVDVWIDDTPEAIHNERHFIA